jgi:hypothetical protein
VEGTAVHAARRRLWAVLRFGLDALAHLGMMTTGMPLTLLRPHAEDPLEADVAELYDDQALRAWLAAAES